MRLYLNLHEIEGDLVVINIVEIVLCRSVTVSLQDYMGTAPTATAPIIISAGMPSGSGH